jgi:hypothetical protein
VNCRQDRQEVDEEEVEVEDYLDMKPSERTAFRLRADFSGVLPSSLKGQMEVLVKMVDEGHLPELSIVEQVKASIETPRSSQTLQQASKISGASQKEIFLFLSFSASLLGSDLNQSRQASLCPEQSLLPEPNRDPMCSSGSAC